jgi:hypothetical protein
MKISSYSHIAHISQHALNSSATHIPLENSQFGMLLNYFPREAPSARNTFLDKEKLESAMVLSQPLVEPINSFPGSATNR